MAEMKTFIANSSFNGVNLLRSGSTGSSVISNPSGDSIALAPFDLEAAVTALEAPGAISDLLNGTDPRMRDLESAIGTALNGLGANTRRLDNQLRFNTAQRHAHEAALGAIVDADLARESARLTALQTQQQLAIRMLAIANQQSQWILGLFR